MQQKQVPDSKLTLFERRLFAIQLYVIGLFVVALASSIFQFFWFFPLVLFLTGFLLFRGSGRFFGVDTFAYLWLYIVLGLTAVSVAPLRSMASDLYEYIFSCLVLICVLFLSVSFWKVKFHRSYCLGTVVFVSKEKGEVVVVCPYDMRSGVKKGTYVVGNHVEVREGENVKVGLEKKLFSVKPVKIVAKLSF